MTNQRIHDGQLPFTSIGHPFVIIPKFEQPNDIQQAENLANTVNTISRKINLFGTKSLVVKEEFVCSGSSESDSPEI